MAATIEDILREYPRPIAWALSEVDRSRDVVAKFHHLIEMAEETVRYMMLVALARYLDIRDSAQDDIVDRELVRLRHPSFGDCVSNLATIEGYLTRVDQPPFETMLVAPVECPSMLEIAAQVGEPGRRRISPITFARHLVTLRNATTGHGTVGAEQAAALVGSLTTSLVSLLSSIPVLASRPLVFVRTIDYRSPGRYVVECLKLSGTGRPVPTALEVNEPGILRPEFMYVWAAGGGAPLQLTPLMYFHPGSDALFLWTGIRGGIPEYSSIEHKALKHRPDNLESTFQSRAAFFLQAPEPAATRQRPLGAAQGYAKAVAQTIVDGVVTPEERALLKVMRTGLGLSEEEAHQVNDEYGLPEEPAAEVRISGDGPGTRVEATPAAPPGATATDAELRLAPEPACPPRIASLEDVIDWNWDGKTLLDQLISLDYATIAGLHEENEGLPDQWAPVFMEHPDTWRLLVDGPRRIVGYWHFVPLFEEEFQLAKQGRLLDGQITADKICYLELPGTYKIYFVSISLLPRYRGMRNFRLLVDSLFDTFTDLARRGVYFSEVCANGFSPEGIALCRTLGMKYVGDHQDNGKVFGVSFVPLPDLTILRSHLEFVSLYSNLMT